MTILQQLDTINPTTSQIGYYKVGDELFANKYHALVKATESNTEVSYHWFDDKFDNFDRSLLGTRSLNDLYLQRALQLREKYEYLILNYSGGADSWNILKIFLDNNIKLDHIMVSWPISAVDAGYYTPNNKDVSANNFMSEWDFTMKPDIEWLQREYPEIKIELIDWAKPFMEDPEFVKRELFEQLNHFHNMADLARSTLFSQTEKELCEQGVKVGTIWGIDKPMVSIDLETQQCGLVFADSITTVGHPPLWNPHGTEYFYWAPDMPDIVFEMAYQTVQWFKARPSLQKYMWKTDLRKNVPFLTVMQTNQVATRSSCYPSWESKPTKFQVNKPMKPARDDKDFWMYQNENLIHHKIRWQEIYDEYLGALSAQFVVLDKKKNRVGYKVYYTKWHYVCDF